LACGPTQGARHGRRVRVQLELDPGSVARRGGGARKKLTGGPRPSATGDGAHGYSGSGPRWAGKFSWLGCAAGGKQTRGKAEGLPADFAALGRGKTGLGGWFSSFLFPISSSI
jgi:hypothetical protein